MKQIVSNKTYQKIDRVNNRTDYSFGWCEERFCGRCNTKIIHSVYLTEHKPNESFTQNVPTKIGFYVCDFCGNYQRAK